MKFNPKSFHHIFDFLKIVVAEEIRNDPAISNIEITDHGCSKEHAVMIFFVKRALERIVAKKSASLLYRREEYPFFVLKEWYDVEDEIGMMAAPTPAAGTTQQPADRDAAGGVP